MICCCKPVQRKRRFYVLGYAAAIQSRIIARE
jgi:hypothetical protein